MKLNRLVAMLVVVLAATAPRARAQETQEAAQPSRGPVMPSYPAANAAAADPVAAPAAPQTPQEDSIELVGPTASQKAHQEAAAKAQADAEAAAKARAAEQAKAEAEAAVRAKIEAEVRARMEAEAKARAEAEAKAQAEAAERARVQAEADAKVRAAAEAQARAQAEADARARADADAKAQAAAQAKAQAQAAAEQKAAAQRAAAHPNAQPADDVLVDPLPLPVAETPAPAPAPAATAGLPVPPPAPEEGSVDLVAAPTRRVITPGSPPPLPPPPAYQPPPAPAAYAAPAPYAPAPVPAYPPPAPSYPPPAPAQASYAAPAPAKAYAQPAYPPPAYPQPAPAPTSAQPAYPQPAYPQPAYAQPAPVPAPSSVSPGYVDAAAHMREVDAAAKQAQLCKQAKKKHRKGKALAEACNMPSPELPLPTAMVADNRVDQLPLSPIDASSNRGVIVASPPPAQVAQPASYQTASLQTAPSVQPIDERTPGTRVASAGSPVVAPSYSQPQLRPDPIDERPTMSIPNDERTRRARGFRASDEITAGPALINNALTLSGDVVPDSLVMAFTYRYTSDDSGASHHGLFLTAGGAPCDDAGSCSFRASGLLGFSPTGSNAFVVNNNGVLRGDALAYSSLYAGANMKGRTDSGFGFDAGAQVQSLSMTYKQGSNVPADGNASLTQLKLSAAGSLQSGGFEARLLFQGNAYLSGDTSATTGAPLRGVFFDPELSGLASGPQGIFAKLEARYSFSFGLTAQLSYGYLTYAGAEWANANVIAARLAQQVSRFQFGVGLTEQLDSPSVMPAGASLGDYATLYFNGFVGASF